MRRSLRTWSFALSIAFILFTNCGLLPKKVKPGEVFTLRTGEKVSIQGADLSIELKSVGRQWYVDRKAESPYAELIVKGRGASAPRHVTVGESIVVDDYTIKVTAANPFRDNGGPNCKLVVTHN